MEIKIPIKIKIERPAAQYMLIYIFQHIFPPFIITNPNTLEKVLKAKQIEELSTHNAFIQFGTESPYDKEQR